MTSGNWTFHIGPFEVLEWPTEAHTMGIGKCCDGRACVSN
jgi:hypothetical protein